MSWGVRVDETRIMAVGGAGARWWAECRWRMEAKHGEWNPVVEVSSLGGDVVFLPRLDKSHAEEWVEYAWRRMVPKAAMKVVWVSGGCGMRCDYEWSAYPRPDAHHCCLENGHPGHTHECVCGAPVLASGGAA